MSKMQSRQELTTAGQIVWWAIGLVVAYVVFTASWSIVVGNQAPGSGFETFIWTGLQFSVAAGAVCSLFVARDLLAGKRLTISWAVLTQPPGDEDCRHLWVWARRVAVAYILVLLFMLLGVMNLWLHGERWNP